jgi:hypothetical protein
MTGSAAAERRFALFLALSRVAHLIALLELNPRLRPLPLDFGDAPNAGMPLVARVEPPKVAPTEPPSASPPPIAARAPAPAPRLPAIAPPESRRPPPLLTAPSPAPAIEPPLLEPIEPAPPLPLPAPAERSIAQAYPDLAAYVAARRRARGEPADGYTPQARGDDAAGDAIARRDRIVAQNLASINAPTFGEPRNTGGLFQITRIGHSDAEFTFFGWNADIRRRASQRIEVRRGSEPDIRIAVVRRMIAIIRQYEQEDFTWRSNRLGRDVTLSARQADTPGLEDFLMREFF